jgi:MOSC domain-containing protein YiiM
VKWPELLSHLHARHDQLFGINARVIVAGRIAVGEQVTVEPPPGA